MSGTVKTARELGNYIIEKYKIKCLECGSEFIPKILYFIDVMSKDVININSPNKRLVRNQMCDNCIAPSNFLWGYYGKERYISFIKQL